MKLSKKILLGVTIGCLGLGLVACGGNKEKEESKSKPNKENQELIIGVCPGPYGEMVEDVIAPLMKKEGYTVKTKLFNDYVQPDKALDAKKIDANLMQHSAYLEKFAADNDLDIVASKVVPTLGMGIYSNEIKDLKDLPKGAKISIANDAINLSRTLQFLQEEELITIKDDVEETKMTVKDIVDNPKELEFKPLEAAQLSRSLENVDASLIPGNYSWAADLDPAKALALETQKEEYKNVVAIRKEDENKKLGKAFKKVLESNEFKEAIKKSSFKDFGKPADWK